MKPVGEVYKPSGAFHVQQTFVAASAGLFAAVAVAAVIWVWEYCPIPTLLIVTSLIQGFLVGFALAFLFRIAKLRNQTLAFLICLLAGFGSAALVHFGHYVRMVYQLQTDVLAENPAPEVVKFVTDHPFEAFDQIVLLPQTNGYGGFVGAMMVRNTIGERLRGNNISGGFLWGLWVVEAGCVVFLAITMGMAAVNKPFCEDCGFWCDPKILLHLPAAFREQLEQAIVNDDWKTVATIVAGKAEIPEDSPHQGALTITEVCCPGCDGAYVDDSHSYNDGKNDKTEQVLPTVRISPEMLAVFRAGPPDIEDEESDLLTDEENDDKDDPEFPPDDSPANAKPIV